MAELLADAAPDILAFTAFTVSPLAEAVVQQPTGTAEPGDQAPQSLPPKGDVVGIFPNRLVGTAAGGRGAGRTARRMGRGPTLPCLHQRRRHPNFDSSQHPGGISLNHFNKDDVNYTT